MTAVSHVETEINNKLDGYEPRDSNDDTARVLRAFLDYLPRDGRANLADDITGCQTDGDLQSLASRLVEGLLLPMKMANRPSHGDGGDIEKACMQRDGNICVVTQVYDVHQPAPDDKSMLTSYLAAVHILPFLEEERSASSGVWFNVRRYFPSMRSELDDHHQVDGLYHNPRNVITLMDPLYRDFGDFRVSLEPTSNNNASHVYRLRTHRNFSTCLVPFLPENGLVTLTNHNNEKDECPLPSPVLLETHAAIAQILDATDGSTDIRRLLSVKFLRRR